MNGEVKQVATFYDTDASAEKTPETFGNFCYDNETGIGVITAFENIVKQIEKIKDDIDGWNQCGTTLVSKYEAFSNFEEEISSIKQRMENSSNAMSERLTKILEDARDFVNYKMREDSSYIKDLELLNSTISKLGASTESN